MAAKQTIKLLCAVKRGANALCVVIYKLIYYYVDEKLNLSKSDVVVIYFSLSSHAHTHCSPLIGNRGAVCIGVVYTTVLNDKLTSI